VNIERVKGTDGCSTSLKRHFLNKSDGADIRWDDGLHQTERYYLPSAPDHPLTERLRDPVAVPRPKRRVKRAAHALMPPFRRMN
jgi:hypothetical protein